MKKYLVIGNPIEHSLSPKLHNYWIKKNNIFAGIHNGSTDYAKKMIEKGFQFVTVGADSRFISAGAKNTVENLKGTVKSELSKAY